MSHPHGKKQHGRLTGISKLPQTRSSYSRSCMRSEGGGEGEVNVLHVIDEAPCILGINIVNPCEAFERWRCQEFVEAVDCTSSAIEVLGVTCHSPGVEVTLQNLRALTRRDVKKSRSQSDYKDELTYSRML